MELKARSLWVQQLFRGTSLGSAAGANVATINSGTTGWVFNGQTGAAASANKGILAWALVDTSVSGLGTSFATADTATGLLRPLNTSTEMTTNTLTANNNILYNTSSSTNTVSVNSLTFSGSSTLTVNAPINGAVQNLQVQSGGILVQNGVTATITGGLLQALLLFPPIIVQRRRAPPA